MQIWLIMAITTALFTSFATLIEKKSLKDHHALEFSFLLSLFVLIISIPMFFYIDYDALSSLSIMLMFIMAVFFSYAFLLLAKATRHLDVSIVSPLMVFSPAVVALLNYLFLKEQLSYLQILGVTALVVGLYILESHRRQNFLDPFKKIIKSKFLHFVFIALLLYAFSSLFERILYVKMNVSPFTFLPIIHLFLFLIYLFLIIFKHYGVVSVAHNFKHSWHIVFLMAIVVLTHRTSHSIALSMAPLAFLVPSIKRLSALITTFLGGEFFHEKGLKRKIFACVIMLFGTFLMLF